MRFGWGNLYATARFCLLQKPQVENQKSLNIVSRQIAKYGRAKLLASTSTVPKQRRKFSRSPTRNQNSNRV